VMLHAVWMIETHCETADRTMSWLTSLTRGRDPMTATALPALVQLGAQILSPPAPQSRPVSRGSYSIGPLGMTTPIHALLLILS
jgi:hypothetical protein